MSRGCKAPSQSPARTKVRYPLCKRLGQAEDARAYNELIASWTGVESAANTAPQPAKQGEMFP